MRRLAVFLLVLLAGCSHKPKAPALTNDPIYNNSRAGFRFVAPQGWAQTANADFPADAADNKERMLVRYETRTGDAVAMLEVSFMTAPESADLNAALNGPSHGVRNWQRDDKVESIDVQTVPANRYSFRAGAVAKEVTVLRRGDRIFFFTSVFASKDEQNRDLARRAVESVVWTK